MSVRAGVQCCMKEYMVVAHSCSPPEAILLLVLA